MIMNELDHSRGQEWWDAHFMDRAKVAAGASRDPSSKCGAIVVRPDKTVACDGFNGFPRRMDDHPSIYADRPRKYKRVLHAEVNALHFRREPLEGCTLYTWPYAPCSNCALHIIQAGIVRVVAPPLDKLPERWMADMVLGQEFFIEAGVQFVPFVGMH
jgi:dCMP deaminase